MWRITVTGVVQGVGFRPSVIRTAFKRNARGFVRNDGSHVTILVDHDPGGFIEDLKAELGPIARIESTDIKEEKIEPPVSFTIHSSIEGKRDSSLPYDTAVCETCLQEMKDPKNRRYRYPFTNCTDCGARYTVIEKLPYDRERTTMDAFRTCPKCSREYSDMSFRRYHAQTLSCTEDGPIYRYLDADLKEIASGWGAFIECARGIDGGKPIIVKGWGGMHVISDPEKLEELRRWCGRPYKPFAIMIRDIETAKKISRTGEYENGLLSSPARPIVLVRKKREVPGWARKGLDLASPGLNNVGLYLPYSGIHHLLFDALGEIQSELRWFVMTSANPPGEPMSLTLESAKVLEADGYLVHDRKIAARCDDSVIVPTPNVEIRSTGPFGLKAAVIRKGRGLIPDPIEIPHDRTLIAVGPERNVTITVTRSGKAFTSPYVGNTRYPSVLEYASSSASRFSYLFGADDPEAVICDLHPRYASRILAREIAAEKGIPMMEVQHHHAHAASLQVDAGLEGLGTVVVDGVGYGSDGKPWGGESIICRSSEWKRVGHIEEFGLPGGDRSVYHPERIAHWLTSSVGHRFTTGSSEADRMLLSTHDKAVMTTSMGRFLDALSSLMLGVTWRTYDGEPAIRLETLLATSKEPATEMFRIDRRPGVVPIKERWSILIDELLKNNDTALRPGIKMDNGKKANLAMGIVSSVIDDLVAIISEDEDVPKSREGKNLIGLSGGVSYSVPIMERFVQACRMVDAVPVLHSRVPPGDGGISVGQAVIGGTMGDG
ncbi:MAG: carbamoyltransferase HypF [Candidatus Thermoplasmatota archaeon]|nr:carbamoyltransferase HypF [Candidatus Thermoplasmatota archaeon]